MSRVTVTFDFDGVINRNPKKYAELMKAIVAGGGTVFIVSGIHEEAGPEGCKSAIDARERFIDEYELRNVIEAHYCTAPGRDCARMKAEVCLHKGSDFHFDDSRGMLNKLEEQSPGTVRLLVDDPMRRK